MRGKPYGAKMAGNGSVPEIRPSQRQNEHNSATRFNNWYDANYLSSHLLIKAWRFEGARNPNRENPDRSDTP
jgi:hypothetical protein